MTNLIRVQARGVLALPMDPKLNDAGASTVREYLIKLLQQVWMDQEGFSGKRPFGNSGWSSDLWYPLVEAGMVGGASIVDGEVIGKDWREMDALCFALIRDAIEELGRA